MIWSSERRRIAKETESQFIDEYQYASRSGNQDFAAYLGNCEQQLTVGDERRR